MRKNHLALILLFSEIFFVCLYPFSFPKKALADNLRTPILFTYGHTDGNEQKLFIDTGAFEVANVIEGYTTKGPNYFKDKGLLFAYHVYAAPSQYGSCSDAQTCGQLLANGWKAKFEAGYQAIAVDEFCTTSSLVNNSQKMALEKIRQLYPITASDHKYIFAWGSGKCRSQIGKGVGLEALLSTIKSKADYFMQEIYLPEYNPQFSLFNSYLSEIENAVPGILDKTLVGVGMADTENWTYDTEPNVEFKEFLDEQFHFLKNSQIASRIKGIAVYSYARSRPDNIVWLQRLFDHYYLQGKTTYFSPDGYNLQMIINASFEGGNTPWQFSHATGSNASIVTYGWLANNGIRIIAPKALVKVPHPHSLNDDCLVPANSHALFMNKGSGQGSTVFQTASVVPNTNYVVDVYAKDAASTTREAAFDVLINGSQNLMASVRKEKTQVSTFLSSCPEERELLLWTKMKIFFTTGNESSITFTISDRQAPAGNRLVIDFVQMEKAKGQVPATPSPTTQPSPTPLPPTLTPTKIPNPTQIPTPSLTGQPPNIPGDVNHDGHVNLADYSLFIPKYGTSDSNCDFNRNGTVDMGDYTLLVGNYGKY